MTMTCDRPHVFVEKRDVDVATRDMHIYLYICIQM